MPNNPKWFRYEPDHAGITAIAQSNDMGEAMEAIAFEGAMWAIANAPERSGLLKRSITTERQWVTAGFMQERRAGAIIVADAPHAFASEVLFKGGHRTLRGAGRMLQNKYGSEQSKRRLRKGAM